MIISGLDQLPKSVRDGAATIIKNQNPTPMSPTGTDTDGNITLCAAAAVAYADIEQTEGLDAARQYAEELAATGNRDLVRDRFARMLNEQITCDEIFQRNDAAPEGSRSEIISQLLTPRELADTVFQANDATDEHDRTAVIAEMLNQQTT